MIDDQLMAVIKQFASVSLPSGPVEYVILLHTHPRQLAPRLAELVALAREGLLLGQQLLARHDPFCG